MNVSRLQIVFFGIALAALVASLRFILGTHLGIFGAVLAIVIGLLSLLYRAALSIALVLWNVSGSPRTAYRGHLQAANGRQGVESCNKVPLTRAFSI